MKPTRDYDKEPIVIKDYGDLFIEFLPVLVIWFFFFYKDIKTIFSSRIFEIVSNDFFFAIKPLVIMPLVTIIMIIYFYSQIKKIFKGDAFFKFTEYKVFYKYYDHSLWATETFATKVIDIKQIEKITFCTMSDFHFRYGRNVKTRLKKSIFATILRYLYHTSIYIFSVFPYRFFKLIKNKEPLNLLNKNIVIIFKNENYILVNIYSKKDLHYLLLYFKSKNIKIDYKSVFVHQIQPILTRWNFPNKYEDWSEDFS